MVRLSAFSLGIIYLLALFVACSETAEKTTPAVPLPSSSVSTKETELASFIDKAQKLLAEGMFQEAVTVCQNGLALDSSDNIYLTGYTQGNLYNYVGGKDVFVVKYDASGTKHWTRQFGALSFSQKSQYNSSSQMVSSEDEGKKVSIDSTGNIYLTGNTQGGLDGNSNSGKEDIFLIKYKSM